ncbi:hypothetical protein BX265_0473 [Streptomyces sp. TLI_235]|nr:hypothetical protein BX265_0473 [Streptomyces sp. TLI_235]
MLADAIRAAARVSVSVVSDAVGERELAWGEQLDVREITAFGTNAELTDHAVAAYVTKYATKSADTSGALDRALFCRPCQGRGMTLAAHGTPLQCTACGGTGQARPLPRLAVERHARQMIRTCRELGKRPEFEALKLWKWAHMLGFRGHFSTKSRCYSVALGQLRDERRAWRTEQARAHAGLPDPTPYSSPPWSTPSGRKRSRATSPATSAPAHPAPPLRTPHRRRSPHLPHRHPGPPPPRPIRTRPPQGRTPRPSLGRPRSRQWHRQHPPHPPTHPHRRPDHPPHQDSQLRTPHHPPSPLPALTPHLPQAAGPRQGEGRRELGEQRPRLHPTRRPPHRTRHPHPPLQRPPPPRPPPTDSLPRPEALDRDPPPGTGRRTRRHQGTPRPRPLRRHPHRLAHVRLRLQRNAIDLLGRTLGQPSETGTASDDGDDPPLCAAPVR